MKAQYSYKVGNLYSATREAARQIQRSLRRKGYDKNDTKIIQQVTIERIVR